MPQRYNTVQTVSPSGEIVATYRKTFLYYTDETWASEGDAGFYNGPLGSLGQACMGICMDINPRKFEAPWDAYEFATHCVESGTPLVVLSMAWLTRLTPQELHSSPEEPDLNTLTYWIERFSPIVASEREDEVVLVLANRCGTEPGTVAGVSQGFGDDGEDVVSYAGSSCVLVVKDGSIKIFNLLGKAEERLLVVDTQEVSVGRVLLLPESGLTSRQGAQICTPFEKTMKFHRDDRVTECTFGMILWVVGVRYSRGVVV